MEYLLSEDRQREVKNPRLDPSNRVFDSQQFIKESLARVSYQSLEQQLVDEVGDAEAKTREALKDLIRDNLGTFIDSKDAMDYVYNTDNTLFNGEALSGITDAFDDARAGCDDLVAPTQDLHQEMIRNRKSQDMLEKLYTVLRVPGVLYECCGVRVALRRSTVDVNLFTAAHDDEDEEDGGSGADDAAATTRSRAGKTKRNAGDDDDDEEEEEEEEEEGDEEQGTDDGGSDLNGTRGRAGLDGTVRELHGALESTNPVAAAGSGAGGQKSDFLIAPEEEVFSWYSTPLVRLRDALAQRSRVEDTGNMEGAVLHVRRAMLYLEETYDLERGTLKGVEDAAAANGGEGEGEDRAGAHSQQPSVSDMGDVESQQSQRRGANASASASATSKSAFIFRFSIAFLRAALYVMEQLADELLRCSAADTVLIEDTLSMMMDVSIATVKLHSFCEALLPSLGVRNAEALASLRNQLVEQNNTGADSGGREDTLSTPGSRSADPSSSWNDPGSPQVSGMSFASASSSFAHADGDAARKSVADLVQGATPITSARRHVQRHPVQFFIKVTSQEHNRLMLDSAVELLQEANEWGRKATARTHLLSEAALAAQKAAASAVAGGGGGGYDAFDSGSLAGGLFGAVINDSFSSSFLFTSTKPDKDPSAASSSAAASGQPVGSFVQATGIEAPIAGSAVDAAAQEERTAAGLSRNAEMDVLRAFRTPEATFDTYTTIRIGEYDMTSVLEYSCAQVYLHSKSMLGQLLDRSDTEVNIMAQGPLLNTFAARLLQSSVDNLEHVLVSYWGGIATTIHAGVFDFRPEPGSSFEHMLATVTRDASGNDKTTAGATGAGSGGESGRATSSAAQAHPEDRGAQPGEDDGTAAAAAATARGRGLGSGAAGSMDVPSLRYLPILCDSALPSELREAVKSARELKANSGSPGKDQVLSNNLSFAVADITAITLRDLSMYTVRHMIRSATSIVSSVFLAFVNRSVFAAFVRSIAQYTELDAFQSRHDEAVELHAATLFEVLLGQWDRMMTGINDAVLRMKVAVGESCTQATVTSEVQMSEAADLLEELEALRSTCLRCYLHGVGMLAKAYVAALPLLSPANNSEEDGASGVEYHVRARLSRDFVSTRLSNKLLNTLAVVVDRIAPLLRRHTEVYDSADLFAAKAEDADRLKGKAGGGADDASAAPSRRRVLRRRRGRDGAASGQGSRSHSVAGSLDEDRGGGAGSAAPAGFDAGLDPVTQMIAEHHSRLVQEHLSEHETLIQALVSNILLVFVDTLHRRSHSLCGAPQLCDTDKEHGIVESIADTLALPTATAPVFVENILQPAVFEQLVLLTPEAVSGQDRQQLLNAKLQQFYQVYLGVVSEHCQLAVDAMVGMYLSIPQQFIMNEVRRSGFVVPLFDWQRASAQTCESVRSYIPNCIVRIAEAGETLHWIRQPALGAAVTQRLVAHLAVAFVTSLNVDVCPFEISTECSPEFLTYGTLLLEGEALSILDVVHAVLTVTGSTTPAAQDVQPELLLAEEMLRNTSNAMIQFGNKTCEVLAATAAAGSSGGDTSAGVAGALLTIAERTARRNALVEKASRASRFMVAAIRTHMDEASLATSASSYNTAGQGRQLIERVAKRKEGYESATAATAHTTRKKKLVKKVRKSPAPATEAASTSSPAPAPGETPTRPAARKITRPARIQVDSSMAGGVETPPLPASPTTSAGVTFNLGNQQEADAATSALMAAGSGSILTSTRTAGGTGGAAAAAGGTAGGSRARRVTRRRQSLESPEPDTNAAAAANPRRAGAAAAESAPADPAAGRAARTSTRPLRRNSALGATGASATSAGRRPRAARGVGPAGDDAEAADGAGGGGRSDAGLEARAAARRERRGRRFGRENVVE